MRTNTQRTTASPAGNAQPPLKLPRVLVRLHDDDTATISGDDIDDLQTHRERLGAALASIAEDLACPIRVELIAPDGTRHADILTPTPTASRPESNDPLTTRSRRARDTGISRGGFLAGETVLIAPATATAIADHTGHVAARLSRRTARRALGGVLVFGTVSGTLRVVEP